MSTLFLIFFKENFTMLFAARTYFVLCLLTVKVFTTALRNVEYACRESFFALNACVKLAHFSFLFLLEGKWFNRNGNNLNVASLMAYAAHATLGFAFGQILAAATAYWHMNPTRHPFFDLSQFWQFDIVHFFSS